MEKVKFISKISEILESSFNNPEEDFFQSTLKFVINFDNYSKGCDLIFNEEEISEIFRVVYEYINNREVEGTIGEQSKYALSLTEAINFFLKSREEINEPLKTTTNAIFFILGRMIFATSNGNKGCYIATMAYGNNEHPQVIFLREFRDNVLDKHILGRYFIKTYYKHSPKLVERLKGKENINIFIRKTLNQIIKIIK